MTHIVTDFEKGNKVYHLSQDPEDVKSFKKQIMIVTVVDAFTVRCSWITKKGLSQCEEFYPFELEKA